MATILLSTAGAAIGSGFGGTVLGLSGAVIGRAVGATVGRSIDQRLLGVGSDQGGSGRVEQFRVSGASYGSPIKEIWGRMRIPGQIIWCSRFSERSSVSAGGGKGTSRQTSSSNSYYVSLAIALCKGPALCVGRVWADGQEIAANSIDVRFYAGDEGQLPDPKIVAVEGASEAPAYRGICYLVIEDLDLGRFGNRVPQFSFEVIRSARPNDTDPVQDLSSLVRAVAMIPGTGEYALATTPVHFPLAPGRNSSANIHTIQGITDFEASLGQLETELPNCNAVSLVVSWFGDDLRCSHCEIKPKVEQAELDGVGMPWVVSGIARSSADLVPREVGRPIYGGTPSDRSVIEAIQRLKENGKEVMFYPFVLMDQVAGNSLPDPWSDNPFQPALPWRGRVTLDRAPGLLGTSDGTVEAANEVESFLGFAEPSDFTDAVGTIQFSGSDEWGYRRFILHYAYLCAKAGGVDAFCIGSELKGLTQIRSSIEAFPMVAALQQLAAEVKAILGSGTRVTYAADWSEYSGLNSGGDRIFNLDPLWSDENIDFIGIDNYMPISEWRGEASIIEGGDSIYDIGNLTWGVGRGDGFDWYYDSPDAFLKDRRTPISDSAYGEDWVFRFKDIRSWWSNNHYNRLDGLKEASPTSWLPGSKPIVFTEFGCPAVDRGTNEPNKFIDLRSAESSYPRGSLGNADEYIQLCYFIASDRYWRSDDNNPISPIYGGRMVDFDRSHAWAWDARPFPEFPGNSGLWADGANFRLGHWLNGRASNQRLSDVVAEVVHDCNVEVDVSGLHGFVRGFETDGGLTGRSKLQTLMSAFDFQVSEVEGKLIALNNASFSRLPVLAEEFATVGRSADLRGQRSVRAELPERFRITHYLSGGDFESAVADASLAIEGAGRVSELDLPILLDPDEANSIVERQLAGAWLLRDQIAIGLGPSRSDVVVGGKLDLDGRAYRVVSIEDSEFRSIEAVRVDDLVGARAARTGYNRVRQSPAVASPVAAVFMDLPLLNGSEVPHAPHLAIASEPWPGPVAVWSSSSGSDFVMNSSVDTPSIIGATLTPLAKYRADLWDRGSKLLVRIGAGELASTSMEQVLDGAHLVAVGPSLSGEYEVIQFVSATLVGDSTYELSTLLRGLAGTGGNVPDLLPAGADVVFLGPGLRQIDHPIGLVGLSRDYRIGSAERGVADQNAVTITKSFSGLGMRPYSVCHLTASQQESGDFMFSWKRRTRFGGDSWELLEVPLGEEREAYRISVYLGSALVRQIEVTSTSWTYTATSQVGDGVTGAFEVEIEQWSDIFGPGPAVRALLMA